MKLNIDNISKTYPNGVQALKNVSIEIGNGILDYLVQMEQEIHSNEDYRRFTGCRQWYHHAW